MIAPTPPARPHGWIEPALGPRVRAVMTARTAWSAEHRLAAHASRPPYDEFNVGRHVGDAPDRVHRHRQVLEQVLGSAPVWLDQVHGNRVVRLTSLDVHRADEPQADGAFTTEPGVACTVMVADCLPVLLCAPEGRAVAALHAGWRGLAGAGPMQGQGILEAGVFAVCEAVSCEPAEMRAWMGPCIGPGAFEVGRDVVQAFGADGVQPHPRFVPVSSPREPNEPLHPRWLADLAGLARDRLRGIGVVDVSGGQWCTVGEPSRFFSFRRDGVTGRQAASIALRQ